MSADLAGLFQNVDIFGTQGWPGSLAALRLGVVRFEGLHEAQRGPAPTMSTSDSSVSRSTCALHAFSPNS